MNNTGLNAHNGASKRLKEKTRVVGRGDEKIALERAILEIRHHPYLEGVKCREDGAVFIPQNYRSSAHWTFGGVNRAGYRIVTVSRKHWRVHRLICEAFHGLCPSDKCQVDHIDRNPSNNRPENLRWVTCSENQRNTSSHDRVSARGGTHYYESRQGYQRERYKFHRVYRMGVIMADNKIRWLPATMGLKLLKLPVKQRVLREQKEA